MCRGRNRKKAQRQSYLAMRDARFVTQGQLAFTTMFYRVRPVRTFSAVLWFTSLNTNAKTAQTVAQFKAVIGLGVNIVA